MKRTSREPLDDYREDPVNSSCFGVMEVLDMSQEMFKIYVLEGEVFIMKSSVLLNISLCVLESSGEVWRCLGSELL